MCDDDDRRKMANSHTHTRANGRLNNNKFSQKAQQISSHFAQKRGGERGGNLWFNSEKIIKHKIGMAKQRVGTFYDHIKFYKTV